MEDVSYSEFANSLFAGGLLLQLLRIMSLEGLFQLLVKKSFARVCLRKALKFKVFEVENKVSAAIIGAVFDQGHFFCNKHGVESIFGSIQQGKERVKTSIVPKPKLSLVCVKAKAHRLARFQSGRSLRSLLLGPDLSGFQ